MKGLFIVFFLFTLLLSGCCSPSDCVQAKKGFKLYTPVTVALDKYKADHGNYPSTLNKLIPNYLKSIPVPAGDKVPSEIKYSIKKNEYTLRFHYTGPGVNNCLYSSKLKKWTCSGYY